LSFTADGKTRTRGTQFRTPKINARRLNFKQNCIEMVGEHPPQTTLPPDMRDAWRAACVAYRAVRRTGAKEGCKGSGARGEAGAR
jgi:hypothetical protein